MPRLEERRLQQLRGSSYVLTLPKDWVEELGLGKGSSVFLLTEPGLLIVVPGERAVGPLVDVELDVIGVGRLEELTRALYKIGVGQVRFRTRGPTQQVIGRLRRMRGEVHGLIATAPSENEVLASFSDEVFASLEQGIRVFLTTLVSAAQSAAKNVGSGDSASLPDELADCRLYALALFRYASGLITKPSRDLVVRALPLASLVSARMLDLCEAFEDVATVGRGGFSHLVETFATLVSELTDAIGGDYEALERVGEKVEEVLTGRGVEDCRVYTLFVALSKVIESLKEFTLIRAVLTA
jgi:hypothetical protein